MKSIAHCCIGIAVVILTLNVYGCFQSLRPDNLIEDVMRFGNDDVLLTHSEFTSSISRLDDESELNYAERLTQVIADGMAHVEWLDYHPDIFHQRVPIWENFILHFMGRFSGIPEFERYHFSNPYRSIERGIGICGDASMTLSSLLNEHNIKNTIVTVPGHVLVQAEFDDGTRLLDADYGVILKKGVEYFQHHPEELMQGYQTQLGRINDGEIMIANNLAQNGFTHWQDTRHFITKKYYFEKIAYVLKWLIPLGFILVALMIYRRENGPGRLAS